MEYMHMKLEVLTPVYVGSGETMDPTGYVIKDGPQGPVLHTLDLMAWIEDYPDPRGLARRLGGGNLPAIRGELSREIDTDIYSLGRCQVASARLYQKYQAELDDTQSVHRLQIGMHLRNAQTQAPIIPGSSLKGAMRTPVIDYLDRERGLNLRQRSKESKEGYDDALKEALGDIGNNAFKLLKVGDFEAPLDTSLIVSAVEVGKNDAKKATPKDPCEVVASRLLGPEEGRRLYGRLALGGFSRKGKVKRLELRERGYESKWNWRELAVLVSRFYGRRFQREFEKFYAMPGREKTRQALKQVTEEILKPRPGEMVLRVGHYSHLECVTITNNKAGKFGTTRTLAEGIYPFGWVKLVPCSEEEYLQGLERKAEHDRGIIQTRQQRRQEQIRKKEEALRARLRQREEEERRQEEEARLQAELDNLPPYQRDLRLLREGKLNDNQVYDLYRRLDDMDAELRREVAQALKELWQGQKKKWKEKECTEKQYAKVLHIKEILGEL